jgi:serine/threonine protein kinase
MMTMMMTPPHAFDLHAFEQLAQIGEGSFGTVFKCRKRVDGCVYAVKVIILTSISCKEGTGERG